MESTIKFNQEKSDWIFVLQQAKKGDKQAIQIYYKYMQIVPELDTALTEKKNCLPKYSFVYQKIINQLQDEKEELLIKYKIRVKRAKLYLDSLRIAK